ncbi:MAG: enoyl-CoA hydratase/isomerase family protein [Halieaceae bacterium]|nr:enoyl-CoA hydratase/isomerase family protein [Halieaceae bacterium]
MNYQHITCSVDDDIATISLNRATQRNALTVDMMSDLAEAARAISRDTQVYAVIIQGTGEHFSVGADLSQLNLGDASPTLLEQRQTAELGGELIKNIADIRQPTICAIQGIATGGGACIAAACDFRVAADNAHIGYGEVKLGMNLMWHAIPYAVELVGPARAKRLIMSGKLFDAEQLLGWGFIDELCAPEQLASTALSWAQEYAALPPVAVQMIKRSINRYANPLGDAIMHMDSDQWLLTTQSEDFTEAVDAFMIKRRPKFKGN